MGLFAARPDVAIMISPAPRPTPGGVRTFDLLVWAHYTQPAKTVALREGGGTSPALAPTTEAGPESASR